METDDPNPLPITEFTQQIVSGVRFATLQATPTMNTVLASKVWNPSVHYQYPDSFRQSCREILLCSHAPKEQIPLERTRPALNINAAGLLPRVLWMEVLSFTHRDCKHTQFWVVRMLFLLFIEEPTVFSLSLSDDFVLGFERPESETEFLRRRLLEEQESAARAHQSRLRAEARCQLAEEERDVYRVLARRYQMRMEAALHRAGRTYTASDSDLDSEDEDVEEEDDHDEEEQVAETHAPPNGRAVVARAPVFSSLGEMLRSIHDQSEDEDDDDDSHIDISKTGFATDGDSEMEEEMVFHDADGTESTTEMIEESTTEGEEDGNDAHATYFPIGSSSQGVYSSSGLVVRQPRTVSITNENL